MVATFRDRTRHFRDPFQMGRVLWPDVKFYSGQKELIDAVRTSREVFCVAGNMLGKDFVSGFICTTFFLCPWVYFDREYVRYVESLRSPTNRHPHKVRIVTTSVADDHLTILWAEIARFVTSASVPLLRTKETPNAPLVMLNKELRFYRERWASNPQSYCKGIVFDTKEKLAGHHAEYNLGVGDEASGLSDVVYTQFGTWAKRQLYIGNPNRCASFFKQMVTAGDLIINPKTTP